MAYKEKIYSMLRCVDHEFSYMGNYGAKGEKRLEKIKPTPEQIKKQNQQNRSRYVRRLILSNFDKGDCWVTLKYPKGTRFSNASVMISDFRSFIRKMRNTYRKRDEELKYIYRMEIGKLGAPHIHILLNQSKKLPGTLEIIQQSWKPGGVFIEPYEGDLKVEALADYITKEPDDSTNRQLSFFPEEDRHKFIRYQSSKNLVKPTPEVKEYRRRTLRELMENGPRPSPGYYILKDSICYGTNPYTGMSWYRYTEIIIGHRMPERLNI